MTGVQTCALPISTIADIWNAQADEFNQWDALGEDEKVEFVAVCRIERNKALEKN